MIDDEAGRERARQDEAAAPAADALGQSAKGQDVAKGQDAEDGRSGARGATAEELKGVSAVPTEGGDGEPSGADRRKAPGDEVDPGVG